MSEIKLNITPKYKKFQLASAAGYNIIESGRTYSIQGADNWIDNCFNS